MEYQYLSFLPGEYYDWEQPMIRERMELAKSEGCGQGIRTFAPPLAATDESILHYNKMWDPYNPLYNDPAYAKAAGHPGVPAYPYFGWPKGFAIPPLDKDIGDEFYYTHDGGKFRYERNIYPGDVLNAGAPFNIRYEDRTVPGSDLRAIFNGGSRSYYDQSGERVLTSYSNIRESYRKSAPGTPIKSFQDNMMEWCAYFPPAHVTTDADWERIRALWAQERISGADTPFWEDVDVGLELPKTCSDGPVTYMHMCYWYYLDNSSIFTREELSDRKYLSQVFRDCYGQYIDETSVHFAGRNMPGERMVWYNFTGATLAARTVTNFIGDRGRVSGFGWDLYPYYNEMRVGEPTGAYMFKKVKGMEGRFVNRHGSEGDTCIGRAVVTDKYITDKGEYELEFACWGETLDGDIVQSVPMKAVLPSRRDIKRR